MDSSHRLLGQQYAGLESSGPSPWEESLPYDPAHIGHHLAILAVEQCVPCPLLLSAVAFGHHRRLLLGH